MAIKMTEKSKIEITCFIEKYKTILIDDSCYEEFIKLAKTIRARENGSARTEKKKIAAQLNAKTAGRPREYVKYTILDEDTNISEIKVEKTNKDASLLAAIYDYEKKTGAKVIDRFEC
jgi:beta-N-acetylglucosaminidase